MGTPGSEPAALLKQQDQHAGSEIGAPTANIRSNLNTNDQP